MSVLSLRKTTDMPLDASGRRIISGVNGWDYNVDALLALLNGGLENDNISGTADIAGSKLADASVTRTKADSEFELQAKLYWIDL